jgi:hypothetical protein
MKAISIMPFEDIRFTAQDGSIYSFALQWPTSDKLLIRSLAACH